MKGLYFYKLVSPYKEDVTKDCKLTINEIDSNFITLKDADIKSVAFDEESNKLSITRNNGDILSTSLESLASGVTHNLSVDYDAKCGKIVIKHDDETVVIDGLITEENLGSNVLTHVNSDSTLIGNGTFMKPLGIKATDQTGQFKPCNKFIDVVNGQKLPCSPAKGDRYVTREHISDYGYLYDFKSVRLISQDLCGGWRVPSKEDWDNMLNAIEPCEKDRNHDSLLCNKELGKIAGKLLKASHRWFEDLDPFDFDDDKPCCKCSVDGDDTFDVEEKGNFHFDHKDDRYDHHYMHHHDEHHHDMHHHDEHHHHCHEFEHHPHPHPINPRGIDAYGMRLLPAGYGDGCRFFDYFGKRGGFWTSSMIDNTDIYVKRFDFNKAGVVQTAEGPNMLFSLRLVKDYDGSNFNEIEFINGQMYTCVLMPSLNSKTGFAIWTSDNVAFDDCKYSPKNTYVGRAHSCDNAYTEKVPRFFTAEWDGHKWLKKPLKEGEGVVLFKGIEKDSVYDEYRVIKGQLVSVSSKIYEKLYAEFMLLIKRIQEEIELERQERIDADAALSAKTDELQEQIDIIHTDIYNIKVDIANIYDEIDGIHEDIDAERKERIEADNVLSGAIDDLQDALSAETEARIEADNFLSGAIDTLAEELERIETDNFLSGAIDTLAEELAAETEARIEADDALSGAIDTLREDMEAEVARLDAAISAETEARIEADEQIWDRLISGGTYVSDTGVLTLETRVEENNITIQFNGNYGKF